MVYQHKTNINFLQRFIKQYILIQAKINDFGLQPTVNRNVQKNVVAKQKISQQNLTVL